MTPEVLFPGVYIEEIPSGVRSIAGVATSVAAFVGTAPKGPVAEVMTVDSFAELERRLGGPHDENNLALAVEAFFDNGGKRALVVLAENGSRAAIEAGLAALSDESWNLLCLPPAGDAAEAGGSFAGLGPDGVAKVAAFCEERRAFLILDADQDWGDKDAALAGRAALGSGSRNAALYFPWLRQAGSGQSMPPSGAVAGVFARTDQARGVWKAPAGMEAVLRGVSELSVALTDQDNGELNQAGVSCLRTFAGAGPVVWGARTISSDPEWKYVPVRRLFLFLEHSVDQGTRWAVFEPNNESLWDQLRRSVEAFLHSLWRAGAFQGTTPRDAFFVRCGLDTTTQAEIDRGLVNLELGFAPLKPAEFTILRVVVRSGGRPQVGHSSHQALEQLAAAAADLAGAAEGSRPGGPAMMALFSGPSGTGKTIAARSLAQSLGRALYRVDLAKAHKYIGETEKNLRRLFDQAEAKGAVLFFDEADALFGKRTEVRDAHDRFANIEVSYLLERLREFSGLVVLATSSAEEIDSSFSERSRFRVDFA